MNNVVSLRKSIRLIIEQEESLGSIDLVINELNNILYKKRYTIGYTNYIGLNHFVEVVRVYSNLTGEFSEFIQNFDAGIENIKQRILNKFKSFKSSNTDEEVQDLSLAASHNLKSNNIINESDSKTDDFVREFNRICESSFTVSEIDRINQQISSHLGFFFEIYLEKTINDYIEKEILKKEDFSFNDVKSDLKRRETAVKVSLTYFKIYFKDQSLELENINLDFFVKTCPNIKKEIDKCIKYMNNLLELSRKKKESDYLFWSNTLDSSFPNRPRYDYSIYSNDLNQNNIIINLDLKVTNQKPRKSSSSSHQDVIEAFPNCHYFSIANLLKENNVFIDCTMKELKLKFEYAIIDKHESNRADRSEEGYLIFSNTDYRSYDENAGIQAEININFYKEPTLKQLYFRPDFLSADYARKNNKKYFDNVENTFKSKVEEFGFNNLVKSFLTSGKMPNKRAQRKFLEQNENFVEVRGICVNIVKLNNILNEGIELAKNNFRLILSREKNLRGKKLDIKTTIINVLINFLKSGFKSSNINVTEKFKYFRYANIILDELLKVDGDNLTKFIIGIFNSQKLNSESSISKHLGSVITENLLRSVIKNILAEDDKKSYSGSHPEESYGWSAKEEDFMFDKPGLTTWEKDRQRVKEYLRSMGMLASKKEKKK